MLLDNHKAEIANEEEWQAGWVLLTMIIGVGLAWDKMAKIYYRIDKFAL